MALASAFEPRTLLAAGWTQDGGNAQRSGYQDVSFDPAQLQADWVAPALAWQGTANDDKHIYTTKYQSDADLFLQYRLVALDKQTGAEVWNVAIPGVEYVGMSAPSVVNGVVYVSRAGHSSYTGIQEPHLYGVDAETGEIILDRPVSAQHGYTDRPVVTEEAVIASDGYVVGFSKFDSHSLTKSWSGGGPIHEKPYPTVDDEYVYAYGDQIYELSTGGLTFLTHPQGYSVNAPIVGPSGSVIYSGSKTVGFEFEAVVFAVDGDSHQVKWTYRLPAGYDEPIAKAAGNGVVAVVAGQRLIILNEHTGALIHSWYVPGPLGRSLVLTKNTAFVSAGDWYYSDVYAIDLATGHRVWSHRELDYTGAHANPNIALSGGQLVLAYYDTIQTYRVPNLAPVAQAGDDQSTVENSSINFNGAASTDPDGHPLTYEWDFGDGTTTTGVTPSHTFRDSGTYTVKLTVIDSLGDVSTDSLTVTVTNVAPQIEIRAQGATPGVHISDQFFIVTVTDPSPVDLEWGFTYEYSYGDGTPTETVHDDFQQLLIHRYAQAGTYTLTVKVTDKDGDSDTATFPVVIKNTRLIGNGALDVFGLSTDDTLLLTPTPNLGVTVTINGVTEGPYLSVKSVRVFGNEGSDTIRVEQTRSGRTRYNWSIPTVIMGGLGSDLIDGALSKAPLVLSGNEGNDTLIGGVGRDVLIGGLGTDFLRGGAERDILVGDKVFFERDDHVLSSIQAEWNRSDLSHIERVNHLTNVTSGGLNRGVFGATTVEADNAQDRLDGDAGSNWFVARRGPNADLLMGSARRQVFWIEFPA